MSGFFDKLNSTSKSYDSDNKSSSDVNLFKLKPIDPSTVKDTFMEGYNKFGPEVYQLTERTRHPVLDGPLIDEVMNVNKFVQSGVDGTKKGTQISQIAQPKRPKFMPAAKTGMELFDEETQIPVGPAFDKIFDEKKDGDITVTGGDGRCPIINAFDECDFCEEISDNIRLRKYGRPTQIQKCIMPLIMYKNHDIMGQAQTGSGKTASFLLPIISQILQRKQQINERQNSGHPYAVLVAPTKELAEQLGNDARSFAERTDVRVAISYGDMPLQESINHVRYGCDLFVCTCGRLIHFVRDEIIKLDKLMFLVLDEADKLLNDTFLDCVRAVKQHPSINLEHRTLMFSATFDPEIQNLAREYLREGYFSARVGEVNRTADTVAQTFVRIEKYEKQDYLIRMLRDVAREMRREDNSTYYEVEKTIVFVQHKRQSDRLAVALAQAGFLVISINADRTLKQRSEAKEKFTRNVYNILVATDVAARGLNFPKVAHVVNYDLPEQDPQSYIHRIGRAGRAGNLGRATAFFDFEGEEVRHVGFYVRVLREAKQEVPGFMLELYEKQLKQQEELFRIYGAEPEGQNAWA